MTKPIFILIPVAMLSGCATDLAVTYHSNPEGAYLAQQNGLQMGMAPARLVYSLKDKDRGSDGCWRVMGVTAKWVSEATASVPETRLCYGRGEYNVTLQRPEATGFEKDAQFALQVLQIRQQAQAASEQEQMQMLQLWNATRPTSTTGTVITPNGETYFYNQRTR